MTDKHWHDQKYFFNAPKSYETTEEAGAWADGFNAAVQAFKEELTANLTGQHLHQEEIGKELSEIPPKQHWSDVMLNEGEYPV